MQDESLFEQFANQDTVILAIAKEDKDLDTHGKFYGHFQPAPRFTLLADLDKQTARFRETSVYVIDKQGVVREIFPARCAHGRTGAPCSNRSKR